MHGPTARLESIYASAVYRVQFETEHVLINLQADNRQLRGYLPDERSRWALIGAVNPFSRDYPTVLNRRRHQHFERLLQRRGVAYRQASGSATDGRWSEPALWLVGLSQAQAQMLGRRYAQAAIITGIGERPGCLRWLYGGR